MNLSEDPETSHPGTCVQKLARVGIQYAGFPTRRTRSPRGRRVFCCLLFDPVMHHGKGSIFQLAIMGLLKREFCLSFRP